MRTVILIGAILIADATNPSYCKMMSHDALKVLAVVLGVVMIMDLIEFISRLGSGK